MIDTEKNDLDKHIARLTHTADGWSMTERMKKTADLREGILATGIVIDKQIVEAIDNFGQGAIGLIELSRILQEKKGGS